MSRYHLQDLWLTEDGDLALDENSDLKLASKEDLIAQYAERCVKVTNPDWYYDNIGADLEDLLGMPNSRETAELGKDRIRGALLSTGFFDEQDIWVDAKPADKTVIMFLLYINSPYSEEPIIFRIDLSLGAGVDIRRVA